MGIGHDETSIRSGDGCRLHLERWEPSHRPRARMVVVHGLGEHAGRYRRIAADLVGRGFALAVPDLRGHGRSAGRRIHVRRFSEWVEDVRAVTATLPAGDGVPVVLLGHSQGGLIALHTALDDPRPFAGLVLTSPFLGIPPERQPGAPLALAARLLARLPVVVTFRHDADSSLLSRDPDVVAAWDADPLVARRVSARWYVEVQRALAAAHEAAPRLPLPALVLQAGADRVVDVAATRRFIAAAPPGLVRYRELDGLYHEVLNEPERDTVLDLVAGFVDELIGRDEDSSSDVLP